jgi:hypothetical protein
MGVVRAAHLQATAHLSRYATAASLFTHGHASPIGHVGFSGSALEAMAKD